MLCKEKIVREYALKRQDYVIKSQFNRHSVVFALNVNYIFAVNFISFYCAVAPITFF